MVMTVGLRLVSILKVRATFLGDLVVGGVTCLGFRLLDAGGGR